MSYVSPPITAGLVADYRADYFLDAGLADGATIAQAWNDESGSGNHLDVLVGSPVFKSALYNSRAYVQIGAAGFFRRAVSVLGASAADYTFVVVGYVPSTSNQRGCLVGVGDADGAALGIGSSQFDTYGLYPIGLAGSVAWKPTSGTMNLFEAGPFVFIHARNSTGPTEFILNGMPRAAVTSSAPISPPGAKTTVGAYNTSTVAADTYNFTGSLRRVLVYNAALTSVQMVATALWGAAETAVASGGGAATATVSTVFGRGFN